MIPESVAEEVFSRYYDRLMAYFCNRGLDREDARDSTLVVFRKVFTKWESRRTTGSLPAWIFAIAKNVFKDHLTKTRTDLLQNPVPVADDGSVSGHELQAPSADPERTVEAKSRLAAVASVLAAENPTTRQIFQLKAEGFTNPEIARLVQMPIDTVRGRLRITRHKLRDILGPVRND